MSGMRVLSSGLFVVLAGFATTVSCGSSVIEGSSSDGGAADGSSGSSGAPAENDGGPPPDAFLEAVVGPGTLSGVNDPSACSMQADLSWQLGLAISPKPTTYSDGSTQAGGAVHIGAINPSASMSTGLRGVFSTMGQQFVDNDCTFTETYNNAPLPSGGQPAQGRIWGHVDCPNATVNGMFGVGVDGGPTPRTCEASADFLFENCR